MRGFDTYTLPGKARVVSNQIRRYSRNPWMRTLARRLGTPQNALNWVKQNVRYQRETGDSLYSPLETIKMGYGDCEELTLLVGTLARIQGYPVMVRIISNSTNHIYPLVKIKGKWKSMDATPRYGLPAGYIERKYHTVVEGAVGRLSGLENTEAEKNKETFLEKVLEKLPEGIGFGLGAAIATWLFKDHVKRILRG